LAKYDLICGVQQKPVRCVLYGSEGVGKTTLAAQFPNPVFIDVEDGSNQLPVARLPRPTSWELLVDEIREVRNGNVPCSTLVIDTADAAEELCIKAVCAEKEWTGIEDIGWGKGYTYLAEKFGKLLDLLGEVVDSGRNVVVVSHAMCRKFERPDEEGAYDRFELKLTRKVSPLLKEWCDLLLFLDYKTYVQVETDKSGKVTKAKAKGGKRIIRTTHHPCWDAKNRFGLPDEMPLEYDGLAPHIPDMIMQAPTPAPAPEPSPAMQQLDEQIARMDEDVERAKSMAAVSEPDPRDSYPAELKPLVDLMKTDGISDHDLRQAVGAKGYFPYECPVDQYPAEFVQWLTSVWGNFVGFVKEQRQAQA